MLGVLLRFTKENERLERELKRMGFDVIRPKRPALAGEDRSPWQVLLVDDRECGSMKEYARKAEKAFAEIVGIVRPARINDQSAAEVDFGIDCPKCEGGAPFTLSTLRLSPAFLSMLGDCQVELTVSLYA
jgi:hypothetical protein